MNGDPALDRYFDWMDHVLFDLGGAPVTAGGLLRTLALLVALVWLSSWLRLLRRPTHNRRTLVYRTPARVSWPRPIA